MTRLTIAAAALLVLIGPATAEGQRHGGGHHHGGGHRGSVHRGGVHHAGGHAGHRDVHNGRHHRHRHVLHRGHHYPYPYYSASPYYCSGYPYYGYRYCDYRVSVPPGTIVVEGPTPETIPAEEPPLGPRFGLGVWGSSTRLEGGVETTGYGATARFPGESVELALELGRYTWARGAGGGTRAGGTLAVNLIPRATVTPFVLAGVGVNVIDDQTRDDTLMQGYLEGGAGLALRMTRQFSLAGDLRWSTRRLLEDTATREEQVSLGTAVPPSPEAVPSRQSGIELRLTGIVYF